ncbi:MAG TPA: outer membrane beta-barrel protein [Vicinamibacterales bacterium]|jgi:outer membrane protein W
MFRSKALTSLLVTATILLVPGLAAAQHQSLSVNLGYFTPRSETGRVSGDVLVSDLGALYGDALMFNIKDFNNATIGAEWLVSMGTFLEVGVGAGYYASTAPSVYRDVTNSDGSEIQQDLRLRIIPVSATLRFLPTGRRAPVQPYVGIGVGVLSWRYSETGEFVDSASNIFRANYVDSGTAVGPVVVAGIRFPLGHNFAFGGELRYQKADAPLSKDFLGSRVDLGGMNYSANFILRF